MMSLSGRIGDGEGLADAGPVLLYTRSRKVGSRCASQRRPNIAILERDAEVAKRFSAKIPRKQRLGSMMTIRRNVIMLYRHQDSQSAMMGLFAIGLSPLRFFDRDRVACLGVAPSCHLPEFR